MCRCIIGLHCTHMRVIIPISSSQGNVNSTLVCEFVSLFKLFLSVTDSSSSSWMSSRGNVMLIHFINNMFPRSVILNLRKRRKSKEKSLLVFCWMQWLHNSEIPQFGFKLCFLKSNCFLRFFLAFFVFHFHIFSWS